MLYVKNVLNVNPITGVMTLHDSCIIESPYQPADYDDGCLVIKYVPYLG